MAPRGESGLLPCSPPASSPGRLALLPVPRGPSDRGPRRARPGLGASAGGCPGTAAAGHRLAPGKQAARAKLGRGGLRGHSGGAEDGLGRGRVKHCLSRRSDCFGGYSDLGHTIFRFSARLFHALGIQHVSSLSPRLLSFST